MNNFIDHIISKYGTESACPPYVLLGYVKCGTRSRAGVLCYADSELLATVLRELLGCYGTVDIERTEYHIDGATFSLAAFEETKAQVKMVCGF